MTTPEMRLLLTQDIFSKLKRFSLDKNIKKSIFIFKKIETKVSIIVAQGNYYHIGWFYGGDACPDQSSMKVVFAVISLD
jgi:hypothetical protein